GWRQPSIIDTIKLFDIPKEIVNDNERQRRVYSTEGASPAVLARTDSAKVLEGIEPEIKQVLQYNSENRENTQRFRTYDPSGIAPTLNTMQGGGLEPHIPEFYKKPS